MPGSGPAYGWVNGTTPALSAANLEAFRDDRLTCIIDTPEAHGAVRNGKVINDATMALSSSTLSSASAPFTSGDVGKTIIVPRAGLTVNQNIITTTITAFTDSSHVTLGASAAVAVTGVPAWYGTDDTTAINAAITSVVQKAQANGTNHGEVWFSDGNYCVFGSVIQNGSQAFGGTTQGNAVIPLPNIPTTQPKLTLALRGSWRSAPVWDQSRILTSGVNLLTAQPGGFNGTFGSAAVMGGPTTQQVGTGYSSNLHFIMDGFTWLTPWNWISYCLDLQNVAMCYLGELGCNGLGNQALFTASPTNGGAAIRMPTYWSESQCVLERATIMGYTYGLLPGAGTSVKDAYIVFCQRGVCPAIPSRTMHFDHLITDGCDFHIDNSLLGAGFARLDINNWDTERSGNTTYHFNDSNGWIVGHAIFHAIAEEQPLVNGAKNFRIENYSNANGGNPGVASLSGTLSTGAAITTMPVNALQSAIPAGTFILSDVSGAHTQSWTTTGAARSATTIPVTSQTPNFAYASGTNAYIAIPMPNSTVAYQNPFWRNCAVTITGGTVTVINVDGQITGLTSGTVIVPSGKNITLTYTVAPTWIWTQL